MTVLLQSEIAILPAVMSVVTFVNKVTKMPFLRILRLSSNPPSKGSPDVILPVGTTTPALLSKVGFATLRRC